ncbi:MAG: glycoside hydrolase family 2 [Mogibacterium sp.]|nr:glycoside hydrolase family 2 [Mogibacterium sp.]
MNDLMTAAGERLLRQYKKEGPAFTPWQEYPRPQLRREQWLNLNGEWEFTVTADERMPAGYDEKILLPFAPQSRLSGIRREIPDDSWLWYRRRIVFPEGFRKDRVLLHIGAADQETVVYVNGTPVGEPHHGGYTPIDLDITDALYYDTVNTLVIRVHDCLADTSYPYGKQSLRRGGMWYTPVSGIWQTVWMESVPQDYIRGLTIRTGMDHAEIRLEGVTEGLLELLDAWDPEGFFEIQNGFVRIDFPEPHRWTPEDPYLYRFRITAGEDEITSYFALRTCGIRYFRGVPRLCLNEEPRFFHGLLDQGYWSDGLYTPASPSCYEEDIRRMKALGFNTLRKHLKVEPDLFYYYCDRLGMFVFQDMVNNGTYSFLHDTALPTAGRTRLAAGEERPGRKEPDPHRDGASYVGEKLTRQRFIQSMTETVLKLRNFPCICCWTIFNEGWGQFESTRMYRRLRTLDDSRWIDTASGWFSGGETDLESRHIYFRKLRAPGRQTTGAPQTDAVRKRPFSRAKVRSVTDIPYYDRPDSYTLALGPKPFILSEFGGYVWKPEGHCFDPSASYGYGKYKDRASYVAALRDLYLTQLLPLLPQGLCAAIYTQVSDVEDETNGLLSYDRKVRKVLPEEFLDISEQLKL